MASELDDGLGGDYTLLAADYQLPSVRLERRMEKRLGGIKLPVDMIQVVIVTGLEAIGRGHDQRDLQAFVKEIIYRDPDARSRHPLHQPAGADLPLRRRLQHRSEQPCADRGTSAGE